MRPILVALGAAMAGAAWNAGAANSGTVTISDAGAAAAIGSALDALERGDYAAAKAAAGTAGGTELSPYERGRIGRILAEAEYRLGDPAAARAHLENALASGGLNAQEQSLARLQIGQLYVAEGRWREAIAVLEAWAATAENPDPAASYAIAISYHQLGDYDRALPAAATAAAGADAPLSRLELLAALHLRRNELAAAVPVLERLIERAPDAKDYWLQLSSAQQSLGHYDLSLATMQLAYSAGLLDSDADLRRLADLLVHQGLPHRAAEVLEEAIAARGNDVDAGWLSKLAEAWVRAGELERAVAPLERAAESMASGAGYVRLAELHVERRDWTAARAALETAFARGDLGELGERATLLNGVALYGSNEFAAAREWFARAAEGSAYRPLASRYIEAIDAKTS